MPLAIGLVVIGLVVVLACYAKGERNRRTGFQTLRQWSESKNDPLFPSKGLEGTTQRIQAATIGIVVGFVIVAVGVTLLLTAEAW